MEEGLICGVNPTLRGEGDVNPGEGGVIAREAGTMESMGFRGVADTISSAGAFFDESEGFRLKKKKKKMEKKSLKE